MNKTIYIDDLVIEMINKEIQNQNVNTEEDRIGSISSLPF